MPRRRGRERGLTGVFQAPDCAQNDGAKAAPAACTGAADGAYAPPPAAGRRHRPARRGRPEWAAKSSRSGGKEPATGTPARRNGVRQAKSSAILPVTLRIGLNGSSATSSGGSTARTADGSGTLMRFAARVRLARIEAFAFSCPCPARRGDTFSGQIFRNYYKATPGTLSSGAASRRTGRRRAGRAAGAFRSGKPHRSGRTT